MYDCQIFYAFPLRIQWFLCRFDIPFVKYEREYRNPLSVVYKIKFSTSYHLIHILTYSYNLV